MFTKKIITDRYAIMFNKHTGFEVMSGINGNPDPFTLDYPSMIDIGVMGHCSNNCDFCYQGNINIPNMILGDFKKIIFQSREFVNQVALGGKGDPNKHENFKEIVEYCLENNIVPNYTTSGNGLTEEEVKISKKCGAVAVSAYDKEYTYRALNMFIGSGIKTNIHFVVTRKSFKDAIKILKGKNIWKKYGLVERFPFKKLNAVVFLLFKPQGNGKDKKELCLTHRQIEQFSTMLMENDHAIKIGCDSCMINMVSQHRKLTEREKMMVDTCEGARMSCYISPDMKMTPCSFGDKNIHGEEITINSNISHIWENGKYFKNFRKLLKGNPNRCPYQF